MIILSYTNVPVRFPAQQWEKHSSSQVMANCIAAIRCLQYYVRTQISTVCNAPVIQNSKQMASSVDCNRKFSKRILSTPAILLQKLPKKHSSKKGGRICSNINKLINSQNTFQKRFLIDFPIPSDWQQLSSLLKPTVEWKRKQNENDDLKFEQK